MCDDSNVTITELAKYGQQIQLFCANHKEKRWSTKNIAPLGCRTIFYNLRGKADMGLECDCPRSNLRVAHSSEHKE